MIKQIGLVIWGCKGGCKNVPSNGGPLCSNNVVNTGELVIAQTVKDIRDFIRIHKTGHDFFAIEFTPKYKVFTNYRSSNDSGTGAFIAITIYVPHNMRLLNMRAMLKEMMDRYFQEYMNPLSNTPLPGKYDDIEKFTPILERYSVEPDQPCFRLSSVQDDTPQLVIYDDISLVDKYFASPYRPEFFKCQEVMFLSKKVFDNQTTYDVEFPNTKPTLIETISEPEGESQLHNNLGGLTLLSLTINDEDKLATNGNCPLSETDIISFSLRRNDFYKDFSTGDITVGEAVRRGWLRRHGQKDFEFEPSVQWEPKLFRLPAYNTGAPTENLCGQLFMYYQNNDNSKKTIALRKQEGGECYFDFYGEEICRQYSLGLYPFKNSSEGERYLTILQNIKPNEIHENGVTTNIIEKKYRIQKTIKGPRSFNAKIQVGEWSLQKPIGDETVSVFWPADKLSQLNLSFAADKFNSRIEGYNVVFEPKEQNSFNHQKDDPYEKKFGNEKKKTSVIEKLGALKKWLWSLGAIVVVAFAVFFVYTHFFSKDYVYTLTVKTDVGKIDNIDIDPKLSEYVTCDQNDSKEWQVVFTVPSGDINDFLKTFDTNSVFDVKSENFGDSTYMFFKCMGKEDYNGLRSFFNSQSDKYTSEKEMSVTLPSEALYTKYKSGTVLYDVSSCFTAAKKYQGMKEQFIELAYNIAKNSETPEPMNDFISLSDKYVDLKNSDYYNEIVEKKNAKDESNRQAEINQKMADMNNRLNQLNIDYQTVLSIQSFAKEHNISELESRCKAYVLFFTAKNNQHVVNALNMKAFTSEQKNILKNTYGHGVMEFKFYQKNCGMSFSKAAAKYNELNK